MFTLRTVDADLVGNILDKFPLTFLSYEDISSIEYELAYYPDDYGSTSPYSNSGVFERKDLDYIGAEKAWEFGTGVGVKLGISDARINPYDPDFQGKLSFVSPSSYQNLAYDTNNIVTWHGTNIAGTAAAQGDNTNGTLGVCYDCEIISSNYNYNSLLLLAQQGVRVINMSWSSAFNYFNQTD